MTDLLIATSFFILGFILGAVSLIATVFYAGKRAISKKTTNTQGSKKPGSATDRLNKVKEINNRQIDLQSYAERPQKNSLDGKYKNDLIKQIKLLEEEKTEILKSIIQDGLDPEIAVVTEDGDIKSMKLSEFMANMGIIMPSKKDISTQSKADKRFVVHRGGKDDGGGGETTH